ncbi:hypothetical protein G3578_09395 [Brevibacillus sp. SYP-B805]|uniref:hypothetical protein n=1 Tax=Brevibacillus sp. SYP-B805 TaxID=1578199 RepID=UPI0013EC3F17|nr:hypothetical protein [Brevibacillus sp. SYP-B805]NGQ95369.1 hypothetical protein [Brevibacillus sp. SYP-B805]
MKRPTYTLSSLIKKVFRPGERSLPRHEIKERLQQFLTAYGYELDSETALAKILQMKQSPVRVGHTEAIIELTYQPHQLFDLAYRFLRDTHTPKKFEQIVPELRRQTQFSWNQVTRLLELERDPRFVQYQGDPRWFLAEWKVANDHVYDFMRTNGLRQISLRSLAYFLEHEVGISLREELFLPEADDRFQLEGESLMIVEEAADTPPAMDGHDSLQQAHGPEEHPPMPLEGRAEAAATVSPEWKTKQESIEEEIFVNTLETKSTAAEVSQLLRQALGRLEERNQQMAAEVVSFFQQSNLQAIEELMQEKHKNEQIVQGLRQLLTMTDEQ